MKLVGPIPRSADNNDYRNNHSESMMTGLEVQKWKRIVDDPEKGFKAKDDLDQDLFLREKLFKVNYQQRRN